jgi:hypothetical protein
VARNAQRGAADSRATDDPGIETTGAVRTFIGGSVPTYYREDAEEEAPIGDAPK